MKRIFDLLELYKTSYGQKQDVFGKKTSKGWETCSAADYIKKSNLLSRAFLSLNIRKGQHVATVMNNCPEWNLIDMGLLQVGAVQVPFYPTISKEHFRYIFRHAEIRTAIIGTQDTYNYIKDILQENHIRVFILENDGDTETFDDLLEIGRQNPADEEIRKISESITEDDIATLIYTSGTTGLPKGVMLSHRNLVSQFLAVSSIPGFGPEHRALSFLPLCHVYERMLNYIYQYLGMSVYYAESIDKIAENMREVKPHVFCAVPRVLEKTYDKIVSAGRNLSFVPKNIFFRALNLGKKYDPQKKAIGFTGCSYFLPTC